MESPESGRPGHHQQLALTGNENNQIALYDSILASQRDENEDAAINLRDYWRVLVNRKGTIFIFSFIVVVAALISTFLTTPIYRSTVTLQIERESEKLMDYQRSIPGEGGGNREFYETQYNLLRSRTLARRVINQLGLETSAKAPVETKQSFFKEMQTTISNFLTGVEPEAPSDDPSQKQRPANLEGAFLNNLSIQPVKNSRLVKISYDSPNKNLTADVVNSLAKNYINTTLERRFDSSSYAKNFISERLKQVRADLEDSERNLVNYAKARDSFDLDSIQSSLVTKLDILNGEIVTAETQRIEVESQYKGMEKLGTGAFIQVLEDPVIQKYKETLADLEREYENNLKKFKPAFPKMLQLKSEIDSIKAKFRSQKNNIVAAVKAKYEAAVMKEAMLKSRLSSLKTELLDLNDKSTDYSVLKRDVQTNRDLYDGLLSRMKEVTVVAGLGTNNVSVVDPGVVPGGPIKPNLKKNLIKALILGLFGGIGLAFLFEFLDDSVKSGTEVEKVTGLALLGIIPRAGDDVDEDQSLALVTHDAPVSQIAEAFRSCRTALTYATSVGIPKVLHVTSASAGEGKTTTSFSLAITFAQMGKTVLLINGDLRNPSLQRELNLPNEVGLTTHLTGKALLSTIVLKTHIPNLYAITTGPLPPNPAELLSSDKMRNVIEKTANKFDLVVVDSPPVLGLADALVLANIADATVMVVSSGETRSGALKGSLTRLRRSRANLIGVILNKHVQSTADYGYDYNYSYSYGNHDDDEYEGDYDEEPRKQLTS
ncbi:MAG: polysaccharide biosynthesis tyrosine autokinase [Gammaproteobacteria bacterium]|nr:polysaccharide biosynthesis tyrosine autokinase [Gammaproteobacteria bacterium]